MVATPETGTVLLTGLSTGRQYNFSIYSSDVSGALVTWSLTGVAGSGSDNFIITPNENCVLTDVSIATGQTVTTVFLPLVQNAQIGQVISVANCINTLQNRSVPKLVFGPSRKLQFQQG